MGLAEGLDQAIDVNALASWCEETERIPLNPLRVAAIVLAVIGSFVVLGYLAFDLDLRIVGLWLAIEAVFAAVLAKPCARILRGISKRADDLAKFAAILERIEREPFHSQRLQALQAMLIAEKQSASSRIRSLWKYSDLLEWQKNMVFAPFALVWIWGVQVAFAVEAWRRRSGREVFGWVKALGEIEALASLAAFAFEEAGSVFPQVEDSREPFIEGDELGHPLLPRPRCVRNSVNLGNPLRVLVVSGSNMSGKSTLMRSVGANVVLALAGGSVRASRMKLCPMAIGATLRIQDSLQEGKSRFYAEIVRLRLVVDLARGPLPLLFLLDEILAGTNSHDRLAGSSAVVRGLIDLGAIGIVTTHDLALAEVAERLAPRAENVHFEDDFVDGQMRFDYRMKPGVVKNSNALALMRAVGLDV